MEKVVDDSDDVRLQCERDWKRLKTVQAELQSLPGETLRESSREMSGIDPPALCQILQEHEKRLKAELQALQGREMNTFPENSQLQEILVEQDQVKRLDQLKETMTFLRAKRSDVIEDIKQEEEAYTSLASLNEALKAKVSTLEQSGSAAGGYSALDSLLRDMAVKVDKISERDHFLKQTLKQLLHKYFPLPQHVGPETALDESRTVDKDNLLPLRTIVGKLIEQSLNSPQQPYIEIDDRFWPRHIEFLLRCQIAVKDPQNSHRLKLVPFHL